MGQRKGEYLPIHYGPKWFDKVIDQGSAIPSSELSEAN